MLITVRIASDSDKLGYKLVDKLEDVFYPKLFILMRGHNIQEFIQTKWTNKNIKRRNLNNYLILKLNRLEMSTNIPDIPKVRLPLDLVETFLELDKN